MKKKNSPDAITQQKKSYRKREKDKRLCLSFSKLAVIFALVLIYVGVYCAALLLYSNIKVVSAAKNRIDTENVTSCDAIIVLGAGVRSDGSMSDMLRDRMDRAISLYFDGVSDRILVTGDHGRANYDEVNAMKSYAVECGVDSSCIFMDHAGFSTYESIVRAREVFGVSSAVIVTQKYHLYRALYIADYVGIESVGASADAHTYRGQTLRDIRELFARANDALRRYTRPDPTYLGDAIDIFGDGNVTNDK